MEIKLSRKISAFFLFLIILQYGTGRVFAESYSFSHFTMSSGLSNNSAYCLRQDFRGFMWIGTLLGGLNRYDGSKFVVYKPELKEGSISSSVIFTIYEDSKNRLWVGTDGGGLNLYNRDKDNFISFRHDADNPFSISSDQVYAVLEDRKGNIWVGTDGGGLNIMREDGSFIPFNPSSESSGSLKNNTIRVLYQDSSHRILVGTEGRGLTVIQEGKDEASSYTHNPENPLSIQSNTIRSIFEDSKGHIWLGLENSGICEFIPEKNIFRPLPLPGKNPDREISVRAITEDNEGKLWVGTDKEGIYIYSPDTGSWETVKNSSRPDSISSNTIRSFFTDSNGHIWAGTRDAGVNLYNPLSSSFKFIDAGGRDNSAQKQIREIIETPDRRIWIATDGGGLKQFSPDTGALKSFSRETGKYSSLTSNQCYSLCFDSKGLIWTGTDGGGINIFNPETEKWEKSFRKGDISNLNSDTIWDIFIDKNGELWAGTEGGGLNLYDKSSGTFKSYEFDPKNSTSLNGNSVRDIFEDSKGRLWIGTWDGGLNLMDRKTASFRRFQFDPAVLNSLSDNTVNCIFEDSDKNIWIGTAGGGLNKYDETGPAEAFRVFREEDGLSGDNVLGIVEDNSGDLWITTDNGLSLFNKEKKAFRTYSREDGLQDNEFTQKAYCITSDGVIYAGGTGGVNYFKPDEIKEHYYDPPLLMTGIKILNRDVPIGEYLSPDGSGKKRKVLAKSITETDSIILTQDDRVISFTFAIMDFIAAQRSRYYIFLEGFDEEWNSIGNSGTATFTSLPHGDYTLRVKGENHNGQKLSRELSLDIKILPWFWQTFYFRTLMVFFSAASVYLYIKSKTRQLRRKNEQLSRFSEHIQHAREEERKIAAREVHDELGQTLSALKIDIFQFSKKSGDQYRVQTEGMLTLVNRALDSIKSLSTSLRPKALDTLSLEEALHWQTVEFQSRTKIECSFTKENLDEEIDKEVSTAVFRIYQEILTNILRHSGADHVDITIKYDNNKIILLVSDNGNGIPEEKLKKPDSFGLIGMRERCRNFGGRLTVTTASGRGTTVKAEIPVPARNQPEKDKGL
ncbi:MAG: two-component regulator propeller domain-containing protein [Spirochaetia bacterium]|jgi:signal transduction histidine kinase/ligand-binding sensor domain-containing protein|nr:two-component regulator propeller domain-containing protein [Spirochaetia bacterium]